MASTSWTLGDGRSSQFWSDIWSGGHRITDIAPSLFFLVSSQRRKRHTVEEGLLNRVWIVDISGVMGPTTMNG